MGEVVHYCVGEREIENGIMVKEVSAMFASWIVRYFISLSFRSYIEKTCQHSSAMVTKISCVRVRRQDKEHPCVSFF